MDNHEEPWMIEEPWMVDDDIPIPKVTRDHLLYSLPFDPLSLLRESRESIILKELDDEHGTTSCKFIQTCSEDVLRLISAYCMEDPRLWEIYWAVIYEAAADIQNNVILTEKKEIIND